MRKNRTSNIALKAFGVTAAAGLALTGIASTANAAPGIVDKDAATSINITKCKTPDGALDPGTGTTADACPAGAAPISGVTFAAKKVTSIDLTTNAGWIAADALSKDMAPLLAADTFPFDDITLTGAHTLGDEIVAGTTGTNGKIAFTDAQTEVGMYVVYEKSVPSNVTAGAPFLVTLPMTDPATDNEEWLYDVHVFPKNSVDGIEKSVVDANDNSFGDIVGYQILGDIPNNATLDGYKITDKLDDRLVYQAGHTVVISGDNINGAQLDPATDFTTNAMVGDTLTIELNELGLAKLVANPAAQVQVDFTVKVNGVGEIENTALVFLNKNAIETGKSVETTDPVITKWGSFEALKTGDDGALDGAVFALYSSETDARADVNRISVNGKTTWTTGEADGDTDKGILRIDGLRYSDFADNDAVAVGEAGYQDYWLAEIKAPAGYELLAEPINFTISGNDVEGVVIDGGTIVNVKDVNLFPAVGGAGAMALYIVGGAVVAGAVVLTIRNRRVES